MLFVQANVVLGFLVQTLVDFLVVQVHFDLEFLVEDAAFDNHEFLLQAFADHEIIVQIFVDLVFLVDILASCDLIPDILGHVLGDCEWVGGWRRLAVPYWCGKSAGVEGMRRV